MNVSQPGPPADDTKDPKQVAFEKWLYAPNRDNQTRALNYIRNVARLVPERVALSPTPRYNRTTKRLTVWLFVMTDKGEKVFDAHNGAKKIRATVKVDSPPPWVQ